MDLPPESIETTLKVYLNQIRERLDEAAGIAKAAETFADIGNVQRASRSHSRSYSVRSTRFSIHEVNTFSIQPA
jgi:hypothetical protein